MTNRASNLILRAVVLLAGCTGSGPADPGGSDGNGDSNGSALSADDAALLAALENVRAQCDAVFEATDSQAEQDQRMLDFIQTLPLVVESGSHDGCVWAKLQDGRYLAVVNNRPPSPEGDPDVQKNLPSSDLASLFVYLGTTPLFRPVLNAGGEVGPWLTEDGYNVTMNQRPTLENLVAAANAGVFYLDCHGLSVPVEDGSRTFYAVSETPVDAETLAKYKPEDGVSFVVVPPVTAGSITIQAKNYLMYNHLFVTKKRLSFAKDSLVYYNACDSVVDAKFYNACFEKGASVYLGWTKSVGDGAALRAARFFFDRLLGRNGYRVESPPQRPFNYNAVYNDMVDRAFTVSFNPETGVAAHLIAVEALREGEPGFGLLAPTIRSLDIVGIESADRHIALRGEFGDTQGTVGIGGENVPVRTWSNNNIVVDLNQASPNIHGDVIVKVREHESNKVPLTLWSGTFTVKLQGYGSLLLTTTIQANLVGGVMPTRLRPGEAPTTTGASPQRGDILPNKASMGTISASGVYSTSASTTEWIVNGPSNLPTVYDGERHFTLSGRIDLTTRVLTLNAGIGGYATNGLETRQTTHSMFGDTSGSLYSAYGLGFPNTVTIQLDENYNIPAGFEAAQGPDFGLGPTSYTVQWTAMSAQSPPTAEHAR